MSASRRLDRRRNRMAHRPIVRARLAVAMAHGSTLVEAAAELEVPERTARGWAAEFHWPAWIVMAKNEIAKDPTARDDAVAQYLLDQLGRGAVEQRTPITQAEVDYLAAVVKADAKRTAARWGIPVDSVLAWATARTAGWAVEPVQTELEAEHLRLTLLLLALAGTAGSEPPAGTPPRALDEQIVGAWTPAEVEAFWSQVERTDGCWPWRGPRCGPAGVAKIGPHGLRIDRIASTLTFRAPSGPCPNDIYCARPDHLRPAQPLEVSP